MSYITLIYNRWKLGMFKCLNEEFSGGKGTSVSRQDLPNSRYF